MSNAESVKNLLAEIAKLAVVIDQLAERTHRAVTTAQDLLEIAQRYVRDGEQDDANDPALTDALVAAEYAVHREQQRAIEREELILDRDAFLRDSETTDARRSVNAASGPFDAAASVLMAGVGSLLSSEDLAFSTDAHIDSPNRRLELDRAVESIVTSGETFETFGEERWVSIGLDQGFVEAPDAASTVTLKPLTEEQTQIIKGHLEITDSSGNPVSSEALDEALAGDLGARKRMIDIEAFGAAVAITAAGPEDPPQSLGEEKTEAAAAPLPQPDVAASVDPYESPAPADIGVNAEPVEQAPVLVESTERSHGSDDPDDPDGVLFWMSLTQGHIRPEALTEMAAHAEKLPVEPLDQPSLSIDPAEFAHEIFGEPGGRLVAPQYGGDIGVKTPSSKPPNLYDEVLDLWSTTSLSERQIANRIGATISLVRQQIEHARIDGDDRIDARNSKGILKAHLSDEAKKTLGRPSPLKEEPVPIRGVSAPPKSVPFPARRDVEIGSFAPPLSGADISTGVCTVDLRQNKVFGKKGLMTVAPEVAKTIAFLNKGECFALEVIAERCDWPTSDHLRRAITPMIERLRDIGVVMTSLPVGIHIKQAE